MTRVKLRLNISAFLICVMCIPSLVPVGCAGPDGIADVEAGDPPRFDTTADRTGQPLAPADQSRLEAALEEGHSHITNSRWHEAAAAFEAALAIDPTNRPARDGREIALRHLDQGSSIEDALRIMRLRRESTLAEFDASYSIAREALAERKFSHALGAILSAKANLEENRVVLAVDEFESRRTNAEELIAVIDRAREMHAQLEFPN